MAVVLSEDAPQLCGRALRKGWAVIPFCALAFRQLTPLYLTAFLHFFTAIEMLHLRLATCSSMGSANQLRVCLLTIARISMVSLLTRQQTDRADWELPVDAFLRNIISPVPVALVPINADEGIIRMKNPKAQHGKLIRAATVADAGRGTASPLVPKDYRIILPSLPSGEAMRRAVSLHCDVSGRPYRIDDFRKPLKDLGVTQQDECNHSYARAAGRRTETQQSELLMDEEESEQAYLPATPQKQTTSDDTPVLREKQASFFSHGHERRRKMGSQAAPTTSEQTRPAVMHAASQLQATRPGTPASQANAASTPLKSASQHSLTNETHENEDLPSDLDTLSMELESASAKRRRDSDDGAQVDETQVKSEVQWKVVSGGKKRNAARTVVVAQTRRWPLKLKVNNMDPPWTTRAQ
ncbi:hypothetical protein HPB51_029352 [Rhipicephalus microplus]|uniref:Uncharacterized protein n=1 Tax=Rhipicephalus microplus TaxID=6941 RepID=A0A9J6CUJ3_RHIMP|nr:hypothetical protein HPB51_029352 [Rhipicephalus microplus]